MHIATILVSGALQAFSDHHKPLIPKDISHLITNTAILILTTYNLLSVVSALFTEDWFYITSFTVSYAVTLYHLKIWELPPTCKDCLGLR